MVGGTSVSPGCFAVCRTHSGVVESEMASTSKNVLLGSMIVAALVALLALVDILTAFPFSGRTVFDIVFLLSAAAVIYMAWDSYKELA